MGYMCMTCLREYYKEGLNLTQAFETYCYKCPSVDCGNIQVVEIDDMILPVIKRLNEKGYRTTFTCSGHSYEKNANTYISFDVKTVPSIIPKDFILEDEEYYKANNWEFLNNQICIRKWYKDINKEDLPKEILKTMLDLIEWVEELPVID